MDFFELSVTLEQFGPPGPQVCEALYQPTNQSFYAEINPFGKRIKRMIMALGRPWKMKEGDEINPVSVYTTANPFDLSRLFFNFRTQE